MSQARPPAGPFGQIAALVGGAILLVLGFMFSIVLLAAFAIAALMLGSWFLWKTRHVRKAMREAGAMHSPPSSGDVIEGEAILVEEYRINETRILPADSRKP